MVARLEWFRQTLWLFARNNWLTGLGVVKSPQTRVSHIWELFLWLFEERDVFVFAFINVRMEPYVCQTFWHSPMLALLQRSLHPAMLSTEQLVLSNEYWAVSTPEKYSSTLENHQAAVHSCVFTCLHLMQQVWIFLSDSGRHSMDSGTVWTRPIWMSIFSNRYAWTSALKWLREIQCMRQYTDHRHYKSSIRIKWPEFEAQK